MMRIAQLVNQYNPDLVDVTICGSMAHQEKFAAVAQTLDAAGLRVRVPAIEENVDWSSLAEHQMLAKKKDYMDRHFANIARSRAVLVCNYEKNNKPGYIGVNTLMEMTVAYISGVPTYLLEKPGGGVSTGAPEIAALGGIVLPDGDVAGLIDVLKQGEGHE
jgi:hypothetical protein